MSGRRRGCLVMALVLVAMATYYLGRLSNKGSSAEESNVIISFELNRLGEGSRRIIRYATAEVFLDGVYVGIADISGTRFNLAEGVYDIRLEKDGYLPDEKNVRILGNTQQHLSFTLDEDK